MDRNLLFRELSGLRHYPGSRLYAPSGDRETADYEFETSLGDAFTIGIDLGLKPKVSSVFIPKGFQDTMEVDVIVYYHGDNNPVSKPKIGESEFKKNGTAFYLDHPLYPLREQLASSKKSAILIVPTLKHTGKKGENNSGNLAKAPGFEKFMDDCLAQLIAKGKVGTGAKIRTIIIAGHSRGGESMSKSLTYSGKYRSNIAECWGFDSLYGAEGPIEKWLNEDVNRLFYHYGSTNSPTPKANALQMKRRVKYGNTILGANDALHLEVPRQYFEERVKGCAKLKETATRSERIWPFSGRENTAAAGAAAARPVSAEGENMDTKILRAVLDLAEKLPGTVENGSLLKKDYVEKQWANRSSNEALKILLPNLYYKIAMGWLNREKKVAAVKDAGVEVIRLLERQFILDPTSSSLDLLPGTLGNYYKTTIKWGRQDYPGNEGCLIYPKKGENCPRKGKGYNQHEAIKMAAALVKILPERRPNKQDALVVSQAEFRQHKTKIQSAVKPVDIVDLVDYGNQKHTQGKDYKLNSLALESFKKMRAEAIKEGVPLIVGSAFRYPSKKRSENTTAVANFSSHHLGLAIDLYLAMTTLDTNKNSVIKKYVEITTRPMSNVILMRESPIHKWMFIHGYKYGWYPYMNEPWHWEYNPPGFREVFWKNL